MIREEKFRINVKAQVERARNKVRKLLDVKISDPNIDEVNFKLDVLKDVTQILNALIPERGKGRTTPVIQCEADGKIIAEFSSVNEAAKANGLKSQNISHALTNKTFCGGFKWKYKLKK